jgi:hypothetical protein
MRPLPILWAETPTPEDWQALRAAKKASGYSDLVQPCQAVLGSPEPILCVGIEPDWVCRFAYIPDLKDPTRAKNAVTAVLITPDDPRMHDEAYLLSKWMGAPVKYVGEEPIELKVAFK